MAKKRFDIPAFTEAWNQACEMTESLARFIAEHELDNPEDDTTSFARYLVDMLDVALVLSGIEDGADG